MISDKFKGYLKDDHKTDQTIKTYLLHVNDYLKWFDHSTGATFSKLQRPNIKEYISYLRNVKELQPQSINSKVSALIKFNTFLVDFGYQDDYVVQKSDMLKIQKKSSLYSKFDKRNIDQLLQTILDADSEDAKRNYALACTLAYAGLRVSEATHIKMKDFDLTSMEIAVWGKGDKCRKAEFNEKVKASLEAWLKDRKRRGIESEYLFQSNRGKALDRTVVFKMINNHSKQISLNITPHDLRHFYV